MEREARPDRLEYYMGHARQAATRGTCTRLKVGAVIVKDDAIVATGYNGAPRKGKHCDHTLENHQSCTSAVHAEINAVIHAGKRDCMGSEMFITHAPCLACSGPMINSGLAVVYFEQHYKNKDGLDRLIDHEVAVSQLSAAMPL